MSFSSEENPKSKIQNLKSPMRVAIVTTAGVTRQFRQWPEAILGRALVARGHRVSAFTLLEEGSDITGQEREDVDGISVQRMRVNEAWVAPGLYLLCCDFARR